MRILYVTETLPYGHGEAFVLPEISELLKRGHQVRIVPFRPCAELVHPQAAQLVPRTISRPYHSPEILTAAAGELLSVPVSALAPLAWFASSRSVIVLLRNLRAYAKSLWLAKVARTWEAGHIHAHWSIATATMAMVASHLTGIPWSFTAHRFDIVENELLALKMAKAQFARFISKSGLELARQCGIGSLESKAILLHMGVELPEASALDARAVAPDPTRVLTVLCPANLVPVKGHIYLIRAVAELRARHRPVKLLIAGRGSLRDSLERDVESLGLREHVTFLGQLSHDDLIQLYALRKVDVVALASLDLGNGVHEGIPVSLMEAMAYEIPVIGTTTGGIPELIGGGAGILVTPGDAVAMANGIERIADDTEFRLQLAKLGKAKVETEFGITSVVDKLVHYFDAAGSALTPG